MKSNNYFSHSLRLLYKSIRQLNKQRQNRTWQDLSKRQQNKLIGRIQKLQNQLSRWSHHLWVKPALASASLALSLVIGSPLQAQEFATPVNNAFGIVFQEDGPIVPTFADMDNDGDADLLTNNGYGNGIAYFENTGTPDAPSYGPQQSAPFGLPGQGFLLTTVGDLDGDGDNDLLAFDIYSYDDTSFKYYENIGTPQIPLFSSVLVQNNPFGLPANPELGLYIPKLVDIDSDGDLDIMAVVYYDDANFVFYNNVGSATNPNFASPETNPFGLSTLQDNEVAFPSFEDLDGDGDLDVFVGLYIYEDENNFNYYENIGNSSPEFAPPVNDPFNLQLQEGFNIPALYDIDNDGDVDILTGFYYDYSPNGITFCENIGGVILPTAADGVVSLDEDSSYTFATSDFNYDDFDSNQDAFITIVTLPTNGTLALNGEAVTVGQNLSSSDIANLVFTPNADEFGEAYATLEFTVNDGINASEGSYTITINVNGVNDAPSFSLATTEDEICAGSADNYMLNVSDINGGINEEDTLSLSATTDNADLISNIVVDYASGNSGTITFDLSNEVGTAIVTGVLNDGTDEVSQTFTINVIDCTSLENLELAKEIALQPNPAQNQVRINTSYLIENVEVYNVVGQLVLQQKIANNVLDISNLMTGSYFVKLEIEGQVVVKKLLVE